VNGELVSYVVVVAIVAIVGVGIGMLVARPIGRAAERFDEDEGDGND
jgi:VIT1/CCC1 family predicted Fe2+/Mn2+ transporter